MQRGEATYLGSGPKGTYYGDPSGAGATNGERVTGLIQVVTSAELVGQPICWMKESPLASLFSEHKQKPEASDDILLLIFLSLHLHSVGVVSNLRFLQQLSLLLQLLHPQAQDSKRQATTNEH